MLQDHSHGRPARAHTLTQSHSLCITHKTRKESALSSLVRIATIGRTTTAERTVGQVDGQTDARLGERRSVQDSTSRDQPRLVKPSYSSPVGEIDGWRGGSRAKQALSLLVDGWTDRRTDRRARHSSAAGRYAATAGRPTDKQSRPSYETQPRRGPSRWGTAPRQRRS